jgi:hypothetical protein
LASVTAESFKTPVVTFPIAICIIYIKSYVATSQKGVYN